MITPAHARTMARYNSWQNANIYAAASKLPDDARKADRGAFFGSIHATLNHLLWADHMWLARFGLMQPPHAKTIADGLEQFASWEGLKSERGKFDAVIERWTDDLKQSDLEGDLYWHSATAGKDVVTPRWIALTHFFNHQTHHRGQVHCLITGFGVKPERTDLPFLPGV